MPGTRWIHVRNFYFFWRVIRNKEAKNEQNKKKQPAPSRRTLPRITKQKQFRRAIQEGPWDHDEDATCGDGRGEVKEASGKGRGEVQEAGNKGPASPEVGIEIVVAAPGGRWKHRTYTRRRSSWRRCRSHRRPRGQLGRAENPQRSQSGAQLGSSCSTSRGGSPATTSAPTGIRSRTGPKSGSGTSPRPSETEARNGGGSSPSPPRSRNQNQEWRRIHLELLRSQNRNPEWKQLTPELPENRSPEQVAARSSTTQDQEPGVAADDPRSPDLQGMRSNKGPISSMALCRSPQHYGTQGTLTCGETMNETKTYTRPTPEIKSNKKKPQAPKHRHWLA
ncbi:hypothetical protein CRENBAI_023646 [Crenichthys baileyi]|uniref:Uncharacterized protein n=1 Tax=Crenichthys baileyi TaxID=28760 RepID=A0AAV9S2X5_9TELE